MTSLRLLRFAGLMLLLGSVASAPAQTVRERLEKDPGFRIYPVVFGVKPTAPRESNSSELATDPARGLSLSRLGTNEHGKFARFGP
jgi:hypothetical protein